MREYDGPEEVGGEALAMGGGDMSDMVDSMDHQYWMHETFDDDDRGYAPEKDIRFKNLCPCDTCEVQAGETCTNLRTGHSCRGPHKGRKVCNSSCWGEAICKRQP